MSRRLLRPSPRSISGRRIGLLQSDEGLSPAKQSGSHGGRRDQFKSALFAARRFSDSSHLSIRRSIGGFADLARKVVVRSFYRRTTSRPCRDRPPQRRISFPRTFQNPLS